MALRVLKFGGTSVETPTHILAVARRILGYRKSGDEVVVVVSAMGQTTDELLRLAERVSRTPGRRELDMLLTAGERISMALLALALESLGCPAISFTGSQSGILTTGRHSDARVRTVRPQRIETELERGRVVIVAGFQGVSPEKEITTLGRGGSDTTAVALGVRLGAATVQIFTDVAGVFSADPRVVPGARKLDALGYETMITLSHLGGRVLFRRAAILARRFGQQLEVLASMSSEKGTRIPDRAPVARPFREEDGSMEVEKIVAVALESPVTWGRVVLPAGAPRRLPDSGPAQFLVFSRATLPSGLIHVQWVALPDSGPSAWLESDSWGPHADLRVDRETSLVSIVGEGVVADGPLLSAVEAHLERNGIQLLGTHTGSLALSLLVAAADGERATRVLHRELIERDSGA